MKDCILILSGGLDSTTLLYDYQERIALAISFDYGSNHNAKEIPFARLHCERLGIKHLVIPLDFMSQYFRSSLLSGDEAIPEGHYADENMKSTVVPFRNGIMLAIAAGMAESNNLQYIMMANHGGDHTIYPDCRPEFVEAFGKATQAGTFNGVSLLSPYCNMTKAEIAAREKFWASTMQKHGRATEVAISIVENVAPAWSAVKRSQKPVSRIQLNTICSQSLYIFVNNRWPEILAN